MTRSLPAILAAVVLAGLVGCIASPPASGPLPGPQANLPVDSEIPATAGFNPPAYVDTATVAAANLEAERLKTAAIAYFASHPDKVTASLDDLNPSDAVTAKAWYRFDAAGLVTRVDAVPNGWTGIVFSLSRQKWVKGSPDDSRLADQDVP